jgi:hypothetical protein
MVRLAAAGFASALLLTLSSASAGASTGQVPKSVVEAQAAKVLAAETGQKPPNVKCPGGLPAKVGASIDCTLTPHGSKTVYPVNVTVQSVKKGTAHFDIQVGQAKGVANKAKFCYDNSALDKATSQAATIKDLLNIFVASQATINDFQGTAPSKIVKQVGALVHAARVAISTGDASAFGTKAIQNDGKQIDAFCGQNPDGTAIGSTTTTVAG